MKIIQRIGWVLFALGLGGIFATPPVLAQELTVAQHQIASDVQFDGTPVPDTNFSPDDGRVVSWVSLDGSIQSQTLRWEFIDPQGHLYVAQERPAQAPLHWVWIDIAGTKAATLSGQWTVKFSIDGTLQFQDHFTISSNGTPPPPSGGSGSGLTVVQHTIAKDVQGGGVTPLPGTNFSFEDDRAISWVKLDGNFNNQSLRWEFLDPQGHLYASEQHPVLSAPVQWVWITIKGTAAAKIFGQWSVKFYINGQLQFQDSFTITSSANPPPPPPPPGGGGNGNANLNVVDHTIAKDVNDGTPVRGTNFSFEDNRAISWVKLDGVFQNQSLRWEFLDPNGHLYASEQHSVANAPIHWVWIVIKGTAASKIFGQWSVKFYIDDKLQFQDNFTISSGGPQTPPSKKFILCAAGDDGVFDSEEILAVVKAWDENQAYKDCGIPSDDDLTLALHLWARGLSVSSSALRVQLQSGRLVVESVDAQGASAEDGKVAFSVEGRNIASVSAKIFTLEGKLVSEGISSSSRVEVSTSSRLANGVYLYILTVRGMNGEVLQSGLKKLVISR